MLGTWCLALVASAVAVARASYHCLPGAVELAERKNLKNPQGESYPLGIWVPDWAAGYAVSAIAHVLIEEMLGYNVVDKGPGPATPDAFYALAGCETPTVINRRGCSDLMSIYSHLSLEGWTTAYQSSWDDVQRDYPATAPLNLGTMGYVGRVSAFLTSELQEEAYYSEGLTLEYYRSYNVSWTNPSKYFDNITAIDTSRLKRCNETRTQVHAAMQKYWEVTGDNEGLDNSTGFPVGRCFQDYFWLSPACRDDPTKCIIFLTAGPGYNFEHHMQRATAYDTAMAIAVAKEYADYQRMPTELNMQFYWWTPDDTFVAMTPREIIYPPSDRAAFYRGDYRGGNPDQPIEKYASQDLAFLAPSVMELMKALYIDINVVNSLLSDALATGDNYSTVACRWLRKNEDIWRAWVPDPSQCFPQFGLFDLRSQSFVTDRKNLGPADTVECRACPAGLKSQRFADNSGVTHICEVCEPGSYQSTSAATSCIPCPSGEYEDQPGQQQCHRCEAGKYQDQLGQSDCKACPVGTTSLGRGAEEIEDCGCHAGSIKMVAGSNNCTKCSEEGMACPFHSTVDVLRSQISPLGDDFQPRVLEGFYSAEMDPLSIFKCRSTSHCPGGAPAHCAGGRRGIPCSLCPKGQTWLQGRCQDCPVSFPILWCLMFAVVLGGLVLLYHATKQFVSARANLVDGVGMVCQVFWELGQTLAVISQMTIDWPEEAQNILAFAKFLIFDMDDFGLRCLLPGFRTASCYAFIAMCFPVVCLWLLLVWRVSQFWKEEWRWKFSRTASLMGQVLMTEFSTISNLALVPFMCYSHPNGMHSLLKHPDVICGQEQHTFMLVIGIMLLVVGVLFFLVGCGYATIMLPAWTAQRRIWRVQMFQFLINRFRHDSWWYEVPLLTRGPLLSLALVLAIDSPAMQVQSIGVILTFYGFLLASAWPWKLPLLNLIDLALAFGIVVLVNAAPLDTRNNAAMPVMAICLLSGIIFVVIVTTLISLIRYFCLKTEDRRLWNLGGLKKPSVIAAKLKGVSLALKTQSQREYAQIERAIGNMSVHDVRQMSTCISILAFELIPMKGHKRSAGGSAWSVMTDNEANFGLYRLSAINVQKNLSMGSDDAAEDADDYGHGRGFRWSARPPSEPNSDEEDLPKNDQASSMPLEPDEVPEAPAVDLPSAPDPEGLQELQQSSHAQVPEKFPQAPDPEGLVELPREALPAPGRRTC